MTKIYTGKGDRGKTTLLKGKKVFKFNPLIEAYGTIDELSSLIGLVISFLKNKRDKAILSQIQKDFYQLMTLSTANKKPIISLISEIKFFEQYIDKTSSKLPKLNRFLLPQGGTIGSLFHLARTVCRRAERRIVFLLQPKNLPVKLDKKNLLIMIKYFNRLSDFLFIMARKYSRQELTAKP